MKEIKKNEKTYVTDEKRKFISQYDKEETQGIHALTEAMSKMAFQLSQITSDRKDRRVRFGSKERALAKKVCIYCDKEECWKSKCPDLKLALQQGLVSLDDAGMIVDAAGNHLKPNYGKGGMKALIRPKTPGTYHVQLSDRGPKTPSAEIADKIHVDIVDYADASLTFDVMLALNNMWKEGFE